MRRCRCRERGIGSPRPSASAPPARLPFWPRAERGSGDGHALSRPLLLLLALEGSHFLSPGAVGYCILQTLTLPRKEQVEGPCSYQEERTGCDDERTAGRGHSSEHLSVVVAAGAAVEIEMCLRGVTCWASVLAWGTQPHREWVAEAVASPCYTSAGESRRYSVAVAEWLRAVGPEQAAPLPGELRVSSD